jgi:hypothetical protein
MSSEPLPERLMPTANPDAARRQRFGIVLAIALISAATAISSFGTKDTWPVASRPPDSRTLETSTAAVAAVWDLELPQAPHREEFQASCLICHSARLPFGQPPFRREKWVEIVHKMVAVYGAPMTPEDEVKVVEYLLAARPQPP